MCWLLNTAEMDQFSWRPLVKELVTFNSAEPGWTPAHSRAFLRLLRYFVEWEGLTDLILNLFDQPLSIESESNRRFFSCSITVRIRWCLQNTQMQGLGHFHKSKVLNFWASFITDSDQILPREREQSGVRWSKALCPSPTQHREQGETILSV